MHQLQFFEQHLLFLRLNKSDSSHKINCTMNIYIYNAMNNFLIDLCFEINASNIFVTDNKMLWLMLAIYLTDLSNIRKKGKINFQFVINAVFSKTYYCNKQNLSKTYYRKETIRIQQKIYSFCENTSIYKDEMNEIK